jgi:hypothetical protein
MYSLQLARRRYSRGELFGQLDINTLEELLSVILQLLISNKWKNKLAHTSVDATNSRFSYRYRP